MLPGGVPAGNGTGSALPRRLLFGSSARQRRVHAVDRGDRHSQSTPAATTAAIRTKATPCNRKGAANAPPSPAKSFRAAVAELPLRPVQELERGGAGVPGDVAAEAAAVLVQVQQADAGIDLAQRAQRGLDVAAFDCCGHGMCAPCCVLMARRILGFPLRSTSESVRLVHSAMTVARKLGESRRESQRQCTIIDSRRFRQATVGGGRLRCCDPLDRNDPALVHRAPDPDVLDLHRIDRQWVVGQDGEVGELAGHDAADLLLQLHRVRRVEGHGLQRAERAHALFGPAEVAVVGDAIDPGPHQEQRLSRRHRHVRVVRVRDSRTFDVAHPHHHIGPSRIEAVAAVVVGERHRVVRVAADDRP